MELNETVRGLLAEELEKLNSQLPYIVKNRDEADDVLEEAQEGVNYWSERLDVTRDRIAAIHETLALA